MTAAVVVQRAGSGAGHHRSQASRSKGRITLRQAASSEAAAIHALIAAHSEEGHLLPRHLDELATHASRFVVAVRRNQIVGCGELAPLSESTAEVRSLVVDPDARGRGVGGALVSELRQRATRDGFTRLCAFTHDAAYFVRLGFSIVPHVWVPEKIALDCHRCALFRRCGQQAVVLPLKAGASPAVSSPTLASWQD